MRLRTLATGFLIWTAGTAAIRLAGHSLLRPGRALPTVILYLASFLSMALLLSLIHIFVNAVKGQARSS